MPTRYPRNWDFGTGVEVLVSGTRDLRGVIHHAQVVDGSTPQQVGREGLIPTPWEGSWSMEGKCRSEIEMSVQTMTEEKVPRIGLAWCGKCSHTPWRHFERIPGLPAAIQGKNLNFRVFGGAGLAPYRGPYSSTVNPTGMRLCLLQ